MTVGEVCAPGGGGGGGALTQIWSSIYILKALMLLGILDVVPRIASDVIFCRLNVNQTQTLGFLVYILLRHFPN